MLLSHFARVSQEDNQRTISTNAKLFLSSKRRDITVVDSDFVVDSDLSDLIIPQCKLDRPCLVADHRFGDSEWLAGSS